MPISDDVLRTFFYAADLGMKGDGVISVDARTLKKLLIEFEALRKNKGHEYMPIIAAHITKDELRRLQEELNVASYEGVFPMVPQHILRELLESVREKT